MLFIFEKMLHQNWNWWHPLDTLSSECAESEKWAVHWFYFKTFSHSIVFEKYFKIGEIGTWLSSPTEFSFWFTKLSSFQTNYKSIKLFLADHISFYVGNYLRNHESSVSMILLLLLAFLSPCHYTHRTKHGHKNWSQFSPKIQFSL